MQFTLKCDDKIVLNNFALYILQCYKILFYEKVALFCRNLFFVDKITFEFYSVISEIFIKLHPEKYYVNNNNFQNINFKYSQVFQIFLINSGF